MNEFQQWCATQTWTASVHEMLTKLWNKTEFYVVAYSHQDAIARATRWIVP